MRNSDSQYSTRMYALEVWVAVELNGLGLRHDSGSTKHMPFFFRYIEMNTGTKRLLVDKNRLSKMESPPNILPKWPVKTYIGPTHKFGEYNLHGCGL
jgi:hypothetical protein